MGKLFGKRIKPILVDENSNIDIDEDHDFKACLDFLTKREQESICKNV